ncbi:LuxR C-terminal-related transcriptional regulator [Lentzea sp. JNUCC 0626]|uniref:helix-turn-helix transcriptional regulator n=1 Tax=Lentzea sp. JNUCC 0626 TaxID=3367513 RepID=UPI0037495E82
MTGKVLLVRDVDRLKPEVLPAFESMIRRLARESVLCVCTAVLPLQSATRTELGAALRRLRDEGLVHHASLRPRSRTQTHALVTAMLGALPEDALVDRLWHLTRGWPAVVVAVVETLRDSGAIMAVDRHAYVAGTTASMDRYDRRELVYAVSRMGEAVWRVAKAIALLSPMGAAAPRLVADALGLTEPEVLDLLGKLKDAGLLHGRPADRSWRFRIPLVAAALRNKLGPFERRWLAQVAVTAVWRGEVTGVDRFHLADLLVLAGRMVDPARACEELVTCADEVAHSDATRAVQWIRAAVDLAADRFQQASLLYKHAMTCALYGTGHLAVETSTKLLHSFRAEIGRDANDLLVPSCFVYISAMHATGNIEALRSTADGESELLPESEAERAAARSLAYLLLNDWRKSFEMIELIHRSSQAGQVLRWLKHITPYVRLYLGVTDGFHNDVVEVRGAVQSAEASPIDLISACSGLVLLGDIAQSDALLVESGTEATTLRIPVQAVRCFYRGEFDRALELTRRHVAMNPHQGCDADMSLALQQAALVQLLGGKLMRARELLDTAYSHRPSLPHVLAIPQGMYEMTFGNLHEARSILLDALDTADEDAVVLHTEATWAALADVDHELGRTDQFPVYLEKIEKIAGQLATETAEVHRLRTRALVHGDRKIASQAIELAKRRGQPVELALVMMRLAKQDLATRDHVHEVYELLGDFKALLARAWVRGLFRARGLAVPGRQATLVENEHLLAVLTAEGLSNKQIATVLLVSEKSVEGRLSRLFSRAGYKSRVELAAAMLGGQLEL